jgi:hypothetical protein
MGELIKAFQRFIARDLVFMVAGGAVVGAFLHTFGRIPRSDDHLVFYLLLAGISYAVGYSVQDAFSLTPLLTTAHVQRPNSFVTWLYRRFTRTEWVDISDIDLDQARERITDGEQLAQLERIITLKQVGNAVGPSFALSGLLFLSKWWTGSDTFDLAVALAAFWLGFVLVCLGWVKGAQQAQFTARHGSEPHAA